MIFLFYPITRVNALPLKSRLKIEENEENTIVLLYKSEGG